ncbi:hypothetical protein MWU58_00985 [Flavobacteriaceae bacterium S0825]|nr:hypothetical protein [Flavobacteriaceae bacterium S0825]
MKIYKLSLIFLIFFLFSIDVTSQVKKDTINVLFVGNSFTFYNNMPQMVQSMSDEGSIYLKTSQSTVGGSSLKDHWEETRGTKTRELLNNSKWDYVVFNNHSLVTINDFDNFVKYTKLFDSLVKKLGAKPIIMMTWPYLSNPLMQEHISKSYIDIGKDLNTLVLPVGDIFMKARKLRPQINFYADDKHPSEDFSYLIALIFYKSFTQNSLDEISHRLTTKDLYGEKTYLTFLSKEMSLFLKQLVNKSSIVASEEFYKN